MKHLNINELHSAINRKKESRTLSFDAVLERCHMKVRNASKNELYRIYFDVPDFLLGYPIYKLNDCIMYIFNHLSQDGFVVKYLFPKTLYISWDIEEINNFQRVQLNAPPNLTVPERLQLQLPRSSDQLLMSPKMFNVQGTPSSALPVSKPNRGTGKRTISTTSKKPQNDSH